MNWKNEQICTLTPLPLPESDAETVAAAGTVDLEAPFFGNYTDHRTSDVYPFIRAAQLDGNPVEGQGWFGQPATLSDPLIRVGDNLRAYYRRRPPHTGTENQVDEGNCIE